MKIERKRANPSKWTFKIKPIQEIVHKYVGWGKNWVDPFAGLNSPAEFTNDINPNMNAKYNMYADKFCENLKGEYDGVLFDPPYSYRQIKECYEKFGLIVDQLDTSSNFYSRVMNAICDKIKYGGYAISCGWNSNGFGKNRGFKIVEILIVAHGGHHNDTIVTIEKKQ